MISPPLPRYADLLMLLLMPPPRYAAA